MNGSWRSGGEFDQVTPSRPFYAFITHESGARGGCVWRGELGTVVFAPLLRAGFLFRGLDHKKEPGEDYRYGGP